MGLPRSQRSRLVLLAAVACLVLGACQLAPAKVWNLEQVHQEDGRPKRRGRIKSDLGYLLQEGLTSSHFGGPEYKAQAAKESRIEDPLGTCFENVCALAGCRRDEKVAGLQAASFAWLAVDCTYPLSRERCVLALGELSQALHLERSPAPPSGTPATPEEVGAAFDALLATTREVVAAPALAGNAMEQIAQRTEALVLEREGALRLLRAVNGLLSGGEGGAVLAPLRELRLELARRTTALALRKALEDGDGRVRAAALEGNLRAFPAERAERVRWALTDPQQGVETPEVVRLRALEFVARYGAPPPAEGESEAEVERALSSLLVDVLRQRLGGPESVAACRALAKIRGEPESLHPEVWLARWRAETEATPLAPPNRDEASPPGSAP
jgi:hypothetical protein